jgi:hypothetical protein
MSIFISLFVCNVTIVFDLSIDVCMYLLLGFETVQKRTRLFVSYGPMKNS